MLLNSLMSKFLSATVVLLGLFAHSAGSSSAADDFYNALLYRASQRDTDGRHPKRSGKFTAAYDDLIMDIVQTYNGRESLSRQREIFNRLVSQLGMLEMSKTQFNQRAGAVRRRLGDFNKQSSRRIPTVGVEVAELLDSIFNEDPTISVHGAFKALEQRMSGLDCALPSIVEVVNWLKYRRCLLRRSSKETGEKTTSGNVNEEDLGGDLNLALSFSAGALGSGENIASSQQEGRQVVERTSKNEEKLEIFGNKFAASQAYMTLLTGARQRSERVAALKGSHKFTREHIE